MSLQTVYQNGLLKTVNDNFSDLNGFGTYTAVADDATAGTVDIDTGVSGATVFIVQILRAGAVATSDAAISISAGVLTVADGSTYTLTADDVINYWAA